MNVKKATINSEIKEQKGTNIMADLPKINVFGSKPVNAIIVPELPLSVRNNCQSGRWTIGDQEYGSKVAMTILKFSKFFGSLGQTNNTLWGQLWFVAEAGDLPQGVVLVTYIKGRSLSDFNRKVTEVMARGVEPAEGIFVPEFVKHSGSKPDETGVAKPINYYSLKWDWYERGAKFPSTNDPVLKQLDAGADKAMERLSHAAVALNDENTQSRLLDLEGTKYMACLDHLPPTEIVRLMALQNNTNANNTDILLPANSNGNQLEVALLR
ncbi:MAG TPA: hypothetical protein V6D13_19660 [Halomicronema sp.]